MMKDFIQLGSTPTEEECAQVGTDDGFERSKKECSVYIAQLNRQFPKQPGNCYFKTKTFQHSIGKNDIAEIKEVVLFFENNDEEESKWAFALEERLPDHWDEQALKELVPILTTHTTIVSENTKSVSDAIKKIEDAGGVVMMPGDDRIEINHEIVNDIPAEITSDELAKRHGYSSATDMVLEYGYDSIIPACCIHGCETEPDGVCEHGCPSLLMAEGMI